MNKKKKVLIYFCLLLTLVCALIVGINSVSGATVDTSTRNTPVAFGYMRKGFYAKGLFWSFYSDGTNLGWEFSSDGSTWVGAFTTIGSGYYGEQFSIWFDGTYVHYTRQDYALTYDLFYRRGEPENDGSITWSTSEQVIHDGISTNMFLYPSITVDTNGYAWIGANNKQSDGDDFPVALKNDYNNGTWSTDFITELNAVDHTGWRVTVVPLTDGKVYAVYCKYSTLPLGRLYNASGMWEPEENDLGDYFYAGYATFSVVAIGDNVHFVYTRETTNQIRYNNYTIASGWGLNDVLVQTGVTGSTSPSLTKVQGKNLYCFWTSTVTDHVYYRNWYPETGWNSTLTDWIDESVDDIWQDWTHSSFYQGYGGNIGLFYSTKLGSPYNIKFLNITLASSPIIPDKPLNLFGAGFNDTVPSVELRWSHNLTNTDFFEIQNSTDNITYEYLGQSATSNYTDTDVINGTRRYYRVRACYNSGGWQNSSFSDVNYERVYFIIAIPSTGGGIVWWLGTLFILIPIILVLFLILKRK